VGNDSAKTSDIVIKPVGWKKTAEYMRTMEKTGGCGWQEKLVPFFWTHATGLSERWQKKETAARDYE
jgi:hypothetical protein